MDALLQKIFGMSTDEIEMEKNTLWLEGVHLAPY